MEIIEKIIAKDVRMRKVWNELSENAKQKIVENIAVFVTITPLIIEATVEIYFCDMLSVYQIGRNDGIDFCVNHIKKNQQ